MPSLDGNIGVEIVEAQIAGGEHFGQHDDLPGMHRNGKRNLNRFLSSLGRLAECQLTAS